MKNWLFTVLLACLAGTVLFIFLRKPIAQQQLPLPAADNNHVVATPSAVPAVVPAATTVQGNLQPIPAVTYNAPTQAPPATVPPLAPDLLNVAPMTVLENMRTSFRQFASVFGGNPVGTNQEITRALMGDNPKHVNFLKADGNRVNSNGELVDVWGTPYFFHQLSGTLMEIRSAGPDRQMWTDDDLVIR